MTINDLVERIDRRLCELADEQARLQRARLALLNGSAATPDPVNRSFPPRGAATAKRASTHRYEVVPAGKLTGLLAGAEGLRTRELAQRTNGDPALIRDVLKEQEAAGNVRRSGIRAATRWHLITDEDRLAARVAELTSPTRRAPARKS